MDFRAEWSDSLAKLPFVTVTITNNANAEVDRYRMTIDQFIEAMIDSEYKERHKLDFKRYQKLKPKQIYDRSVSGVLPERCLSHVWLSHDDNAQMVFLEVPKRRWDTFCRETPYDEVGFPRLVFGYKMKGSTIQSLFVVAVKDDGRITSDTPIYQFPFSNVSYGGSVCMGTNRWPEIHDLSQLSTLHNIFFAAPFSHDHEVHVADEAGVEGQLRALFDKTVGKDFPDEWLLPMNITLGQYIENFKWTKSRRFGR